MLSPTSFAAVRASYLVTAVSRMFYVMFVCLCNWRDQLLRDKRARYTVCARAGVPRATDVTAGRLAVGGLPRRPAETRYTHGRTTEISKQTTSAAASAVLLPPILELLPSI